MSLSSDQEGARSPQSYLARTESLATLAEFADFPDDAFHRGPFEGSRWLETWRQTMLAKGSELFLVSIYKQETALLGYLFLRSRRNGLMVLECVGVGVSDYNAPMAAPGWLASDCDDQAIRAAVLKALPAADILHLERMAPEVAGKGNPLFSHPRAIPSRQSGWPVKIDENWDSYFARLSPKMREKLGKARRRFLRAEGAAMTLVASEAEAMRGLDKLEALQSRRIREKGLDYDLDDAPFRAFYRAIAAQGVPSGLIAMAVLEAEGEIKAVNFGLRHGDRLVYLRTANELGTWAPFALGLVVCEFLMAQLHKSGLRIFDFGMGDYAYKLRFLPAPMPLRDLVLPLSWKGHIPAFLFSMRRRIGCSPLYLRFKAWRAVKSDTARNPRENTSSE